MIFLLYFTYHTFNKYSSKCTPYRYQDGSTGEAFDDLTAKKVEKEYQIIKRNTPKYKYVDRSTPFKRSYQR